MRRAIELAQKGAGRTSPNPMVGAVVVKGGKAVGEGYHAKAGRPHAEIGALKKAGRRARGASLYLNLEPCCHFGRTPPCTDAILAAGVAKVFVGMRDPNPLVAGRGIRILQKAGVRVQTGILREECERLNEVFVKYIRSRTPFVVLKAAISLDGKIATAAGESRWISGAASRKIVHELRDRVDAVLVGAGTVLKDDPLLTARLGRRKGKNPVRIVLDNRNLVPLNSRVFYNADTQRVIYVSTGQLPEERESELRRMGVEICPAPEKDGKVDLRQLLRNLGEMELTSVLIEGGSEVNASAIEAKVVDKIMLFAAPVVIGGRGAPGAVGGEGIESLRDAHPVKRLTVRRVGKDFLLEGYL
ncbi:MAG: bifunctional diaminohydroxyphosphoribosylaminopyrimidine deaminase/5-amino-6-(5-phosphoribosylamino)uracil reductase RibD [Nitrospinae bacterium]|nr:bifunctional diaminohydroxyphosphoribosylaminopyrimidine deaminase/5-amino-6-(5-phosphoribosylamino)uracil reductase RibD [Nitrospinota bacterium]